LNHRIEVLTDPKCQQCPVVGFCWAGCSKLEKSGRNWSEFCSQETLIDYVKQKGDALLGWRA
jgi:radical SAM protein with 4Fe4S-binding SPASM domain